MITVPFFLPGHSFLFHTLGRCDYIDTVQAILLDRTDRLQTPDLAKAYLASRFIKMNRRLLTNKHFNIRKPFSHNQPVTAASTAMINEGDLYAPLQLYTATAAETVIGEDSRFMSFRISFSIEKHPVKQAQKIISVTTMVQFNHLLGRWYFTLARPFHKLALQEILERVIRPSAATGPPAAV